MLCYFTERLGEEGARGYVKPKRRKSYECPFPHCKGSSYDRLADHLAGVHNLKGVVWKPLRHRLLEIAHQEDEDDIYPEEKTMLQKLPRKFEDFIGDSISIDCFLQGIDQQDEEMMFPVPQ